MIRQQAQLELAFEELKLQGFDTVEEAEHMLIELDDSIETLEEELKLKEEEFDAEFGQLLQGA